MRRFFFGFGVLALALASAGMVRAGPLGYTLDVTTHYQFGSPGNVYNGVSGGPDTGFFTITNNGTTTFTGSIGDVAVSQFSGNYSFSYGGLTLAPGQSITFGVNGESSNQGGYNGPFGSVQPGVEIDITGLINGSENVNLSVNDSNIHSGVPRTNPYGVFTDAYVLQGGDPFGRDTGDGFEVTQADGNFRFFEVPSNAAVPEPASIMLFGLGSLGFIGYGWRKRRQTA